MIINKSYVENKQNFILNELNDIASKETLRFVGVFATNYPQLKSWFDHICNSSVVTSYKFFKRDLRIEMSNGTEVKFLVADWTNYAGNQFSDSIVDCCVSSKERCRIMSKTRCSYCNEFKMTVLYPIEQLTEMLEEG